MQKSPNNWDYIPLPVKKNQQLPEAITNPAVSLEDMINQDFNPHYEIENVIHFPDTIEAILKRDNWVTNYIKVVENQELALKMWWSLQNLKDALGSPLIKKAEEALNSIWAAAWKNQRRSTKEQTNKNNSLAHKENKIIYELLDLYVNEQDSDKISRLIVGYCSLASTESFSDNIWTIYLLESLENKDLHNVLKLDLSIPPNIRHLIIAILGYHEKNWTTPFPLEIYLIKILILSTIWDNAEKKLVTPREANQRVQEEQKVIIKRVESRSPEEAGLKSNKDTEKNEDIPTLKRFINIAIEKLNWLFNRSPKDWSNY